MLLDFGVDLQAFFGRKSTRVFITICMIICYGNRRGVVPHCFVSVSGVTYLRVPSGLIRPAEVWPREVRFAHPCRARARHPIHKAMGGHASHGHTSDRAFIPFQFRERTLKHYGRAHLHPVCFSIPSDAIRTLARRYLFCSYEKSTNFSHHIFLLYI